MIPRGVASWIVVLITVVVSVIGVQTAHAQKTYPYKVENQLGGGAAPWTAGGTWELGFPYQQNLVGIQINSTDGGKTLTGTLTYRKPNKRPESLGFRATATGSNKYTVATPTGVGSTWIIGGRTSQAVIALDAKSQNDGKTFTGTMTYKGEGPIGFKASNLAPPGAATYTVQIQPGGSTAPWIAGGSWMLGRYNENLILVRIGSADDGKTLAGLVKYKDGLNLQFRSTATGNNKHTAETNEFSPGSQFTMEDGTWIIGGRTGQAVVALELKSTDDGKTLTGTVTYKGESPIGFKGTETH